MYMHVYQIFFRLKITSTYIILVCKYLEGSCPGPSFGLGPGSGYGSQPKLATDFDAVVIHIIKSSIK